MALTLGLEDDPPAAVQPVLHQLSDETRVVVSEPLGDLAGAWNEVPESSYGVIQQGRDELSPFVPGSPS